MNQNASEFFFLPPPPAGFDQLAARIQDILTQKGRAVVAIDGRCGSGKTTVAALLAARLDCTVLHADDFFGPAGGQL